MASKTPIAQPVGTDVHLTDKEAKIRAKVIERGYEPHDWRWARGKISRTRKADSDSLQIPETSETDKREQSKTRRRTYAGRGVFGLGLCGPSL